MRVSVFRQGERMTRRNTFFDPIPPNEETSPPLDPKVPKRPHVKVTSNVVIALVLALALMFGVGYVSGNATHEHATIGGETVPMVHCQEDETIAYDLATDALGCVHVQTITQQELERVRSLQRAGYDVEGYR